MVKMLIQLYFPSFGKMCAQDYGSKFDVRSLDNYSKIQEVEKFLNRQSPRLSGKIYSSGKEVLDSESSYIPTLLRFVYTTTIRITEFCASESVKK
jgi:hypothetical protein